MLRIMPIVVITGAASGIGAALATGFRQAGYEVMAVDRTAGPNIRVLDVTDEAGVTTFAAGIDRLDVLINAAGIVRRGEEYDTAAFANVLDINLVGTLRMSTA